MRVGFRQGRIEDASRTDWDGTGPRPISWAAWFPADDAAVETEMLVGGPAAPWFDIGCAAQGVPMRGAAPRPLVLLSHGTGGTALAMGWLGRRLAQRGFVAIAPNHHGNTAGEPYRPEGFLCWWERARDLSVLLDHMLADDGFAGRLDMDHVGVAGFSLGSHTALALLGAVTEMERFRVWANGGRFARGPREFPDFVDRVPVLMNTSTVFRASWKRQSHAYRDDRIRSALLLAPAPPVRAFTEASLSQILNPVHIMVGGADTEAPAEVGANWLSERLGACTVGHLDRQAGHGVFLPEATEAGRRDRPELCQDAPGIDRRIVHEAAADAAADLFSR